MDSENSQSGGSWKEALPRMVAAPDQNGRRITRPGFDPAAKQRFYQTLIILVFVKAEVFEAAEAAEPQGSERVDMAGGLDAETS